MALDMIIELKLESIVRKNILNASILEDYFKKQTVVIN